MSTLRSAPLLCLLPITLWAASAHAQDTDPIALYKEANTLYDAQKYPEAEAKYQASWDARKSFDTAGNLGNVELQVGQHREAAEHLGYALKNFPPSGTTEKRAFIEKRYAEALALVSTLDITTNPDGATIYLDDKPIGKTPLVDAVYVEPGGHTVSAKLVGHKDDTKTVEGVKGERQKIFFALTAAGDTTVPELPPKSRPVWPYVAFGGWRPRGSGWGSPSWCSRQARARSARTSWRSSAVATRVVPGRPTSTSAPRLPTSPATSPPSARWASAASPRVAWV